MMPTKNASLQQIIDSHVVCLENKFTNKGDICVTLREEECNIIGTLSLYSSPYWGVVLEDPTCRLPCVLIDIAPQVEKLVNYLGYTVGISKGYVVIDRYKDDKGGVTYFNYFQFCLGDTYILKAPRIQCEEILPQHWKQLMLVVHVTTPIFISDTCVYCLVLVMISLQGKKPRYLWIVLTGKQTIWNVFLIPNREYSLHMMVTKEYFKESIRPLRAVVGKLKGVKFLAEILHHPELWPTLEAVVLPMNTEISLESSLNREKFNCRFPSVWWMSIDEALAVEKEKIVSLWGEVVKVTYSITEDRGGCSLCSIKKCKLPSNSDIPIPESDFWTNPWESSLKMNRALLIPEVEHGTKIVSGIFIPDTFTKVVVMKDVKSGKKATLYIKKWSKHQYSGLFTPGVILCAKLVHKRVSAKQNCYFCSCALSSFEVVGCVTAIRDVVSCSLTKYGFPFVKILPQANVWGILDMWSLSKVILRNGDENSTKENGAQSTKLQPNDETRFNAIATLQVDNHHPNSVTVVVKGDHVRTLLDIPVGIWNKFILATKDQSLEYNPRNEEGGGCRSIDLLFHAYCSIVDKVKKRFHVSCTLMENIDGEDDVYFCTAIGEPDNKYFLDLKI